MKLLIKNCANINLKDSKVLARLIDPKNISNMRVVMGNKKHPLLPNQVNNVRARIRSHGHAHFDMLEMARVTFDA